MSSGWTALRWNVKRSGLLGKRAGVLILFALLSFSCPSLAGASVVGLWHLDERTGTTARDSSGKGHKGHIIGPMTLGVSGKRNTAYRFTPKSAITVLDARDLRPGKANVAISYWMKATIPPTSADYDIFVKGERGSTGGQIKVEVQPNGQASCMFRGSLGSAELQAGPHLLNGRWHHVTCRRKGNRIIQTVDGDKYTVTKATGAIRVSTRIRIGSHLDGGDWYRGILDEVTYSIG